MGYHGHILDVREGRALWHERSSPGRKPSLVGSGKMGRWSWMKKHALSGPLLPRYMVKASAIDASETCRLKDTDCHLET
ncbi:hypothetical protein BHM03_00017511 [Ensete ventricosum]|nr:hypothetical protein BHM03_00017511 [Ensete ventricosum]